MNENDTTSEMMTDLSGHFLIAMPQLDDPNFSHTLTYICEHNEHGALGITVNRPLQITLAELFAHAELPEPFLINNGLNDDLVFSGGPCQKERGFVLHNGTDSWESSININPQVSLTTSKDILIAIAQGKGPSGYLVALGYAGWGEGQLEKEVAQNAWLTVPGDPRLLFEAPVEQRWTAATVPLGIDLNLISTSAGHA